MNMAADVGLDVGYVVVPDDVGVVNVVVGKKMKRKVTGRYAIR
jgi:hypothetical protein